MFYQINSFHRIAFSFVTEYGTCSSVPRMQLEALVGLLELKLQLDDVEITAHFTTQTAFRNRFDHDDRDH
jgi:hypothetical protein